MPRVKRGKTKTKKREKILKETKGFRWHRKKKKRSAKEALIRKWTNAFTGRKNKKRNFRKLWNIKINAGARQNGTKYSELIGLLKENKVELDRKILADLAENEPETFSQIVDKVSKNKPTKKEKEEDK